MNNFVQAILTKNNQAFSRLVGRLKESTTDSIEVQQEKAM